MILVTKPRERNAQVELKSGRVAGWPWVKAKSSDLKADSIGGVLRRLLPMLLVLNHLLACMLWWVSADTYISNVTTDSLMRHFRGLGGATQGQPGLNALAFQLLTYNVINRLHQTLLSGSTCAP